SCRLPEFGLAKLRADIWIYRHSGAAFREKTLARRGRSLNRSKQGERRRNRVKGSLAVTLKEGNHVEDYTPSVRYIDCGGRCRLCTSCVHRRNQRRLGRGVDCHSESPGWRGKEPSYLFVGWYFLSQRRYTSGAQWRAWCLEA